MILVYLGVPVYPEIKGKDNLIQCDAVFRSECAVNPCVIGFGHGMLGVKIVSFFRFLTMHLSVNIPTYKRSDILRECLEALEQQTLPLKDFEVIVVDDGSRDQTTEVVERFQKKGLLQLSYLFQENQGQGIARNHAVEKAKGDIVVLIGDDIIVVPTFLQDHLRGHLRHSLESDAVLGLTQWHPKLTLNPFMRWMTNGSALFGRFGGHQFAYEKLEGKTEADFNFFYTSNLSLKRRLLEKYPFDPSFSGYGWEDIELGYRLKKRESLRLYYEPRALGYHDHPMNEQSLAPRMRAIGRSAWIFHRKYPELRKVPSGLKKMIFHLIASRPVVAVARLFGSDFYYYVLSKKFFLEGLDEVG